MKSKNILEKRSAAYLCAVICVALWGTAFPLIKLGYLRLGIESVGSRLLFAGERFMLAGIFVFLFGLIIYRRPLALKRRDALPVSLLGLVQTFGQYLFAYIGVGLTTATNTSILTGTVSIISVVLAAVFFRFDRLTPLKILGCAAGFFGIAAVNMGSFSFGATFLGDALVLCSALCGAFGNIITKKISVGRDPATVTAWQLCIGGAVLLAVGLLSGGTTDFSRSGGIVILVWLSLVSSVSFLLWTALLRYHPVSRIAVFTTLVPIFGTLWSGILLGEEIFRLNNLISLLFIAVGIIMVNIKTKAME